MSASSHAHWFRDSSDYAHVPRELRAAGSSGATLIRIDQPAGFYTRAGAPEFSLNLFHRGVGRSRAQFGGQVLDVDFSPDLLTLAPADAALAFDNDAPMGCTVILLPTHAVGDALLEIGSSEGPSFGQLHEKAFKEDVILALSSRIWEEAAASDPLGALFADHLIRTLILSLWRLSGHQAKLSQPASLRSSPQVRRAIEYLANHLSGDVTMADLVTEVGLSAGYLTRAFRAETGLPPHRWHLLRRLERACDLLRNDSLSVTQIAFDCGFSSSQHLASIFRKHIGCTPTEYRRRRVG